MLLRLDEEPKLLTSLHEYDGCISRYFGLGRRLEIEVRHERLIDGDLILLVSDGVMKVLSTTDMTSLVQGVYARTGDIGNAARELVTLARVRKSADDITAMVIEVLDE